MRLAKQALLSTRGGQEASAAVLVPALAPSQAQIASAYGFSMLRFARREFFDLPNSDGLLVGSSWTTVCSEGFLYLWG